MLIIVTSNWNNTNKCFQPFSLQKLQLLLLRSQEIPKNVILHFNLYSVLTFCSLITQSELLMLKDHVHISFLKYTIDEDWFLCYCSQHVFCCTNLHINEFTLHKVILGEEICAREYCWSTSDVNDPSIYWTKRRN